MNRFRVVLAFAGALLVLSGTAFTQQRPSSSSPGLQKALQEYMRQAENARGEEGFPLKAVPRTDKAEASVIGTVKLVDSTDFLSDGTPFRIVAVESKRPVTQNVFVVCLGSSFNTSCGRLIAGRRVSFTSDLLIIDEGESAGLALLVVKKLQT
jgi:hypothetical protein